MVSRDLNFYIFRKKKKERKGLGSVSCWDSMCKPSCSPLVHYYCKLLADYRFQEEHVASLAGLQLPRELAYLLPVHISLAAFMALVTFLLDRELAGVRHLELHAFLNGPYVLGPAAHAIILLHIITVAPCGAFTAFSCFLTRSYSSSDTLENPQLQHSSTPTFSTMTFGLTSNSIASFLFLIFESQSGHLISLAPSPWSACIPLSPCNWIYTPL